MFRDFLFFFITLHQNHRISQEGEDLKKIKTLILNGPNNKEAYNPKTRDFSTIFIAKVNFEETPEVFTNDQYFIIFPFLNDFLLYLRVLLIIQKTTL